MAIAIALTEPSDIPVLTDSASVVTALDNETSRHS